MEFHGHKPKTQTKVRFWGLGSTAPRGEAGFQEGFLALREDLGTAFIAADSRASACFNFMCFVLGCVAVLVGIEGCFQVRGGC